MASCPDLVLVSSDGQQFHISREASRVFRALDTMIESLCSYNQDDSGAGRWQGEPIPIHNVSGRILGKMIAWSEEHVTRLSSPSPPPPLSPNTITSTMDNPVQPVVKPKVPKRQPQLPPTVVVPTPWERDFLDKNRDELYDLLLAANYLDAKRLMDILCSRVADLIKGKDPATIRKTFRVPEPPPDDDHNQQTE